MEGKARSPNIKSKTIYVTHNVLSRIMMLRMPSGPCKVESKERIRYVAPTLSSNAKTGLIIQSYTENMSLTLCCNVNMLRKVIASSPTRSPHK